MVPVHSNSIGRLLSLCLWLSSGLVPVVAASVDMAPLRTIYDAHLAQYESEFSSEVAAWKQDYRTEVAKLMQSCQRAGNLEGWQAASAEAARFEAESRIPEESAPGTTDAVKALHARFRPSDAQCAQRRFRKVLDLTSKYQARLDALKIEATRAGKFGDAIAYAAETTRVQELPAVARAREALAASAAPSPPPVPEPVPPPLPDPQADAEGNPAPSPEAAVEAVPPAEPAPAPVPGPPDGILLSEGMTPPAVPGVTFKPVTLSITDRMRVARKLSVRAELNNVSEMERTSYYQSGSTHHILRIGLRTTSSSQVMEGAKLVVEFYGKNVRERASRIIPKPMGALKVDLPKLEGTRWLFVQLPRVSAERTSYRSSYYYSGYHYGLEYYGAVISVFDAEGALVYQAVSAANLMPLAPDKMPELSAPGEGVVDEDPSWNPNDAGE